MNYFFQTYDLQFRSGAEYNPMRTGSINQPYLRANWRCDFTKQYVHQDNIIRMFFGESRYKNIDYGCLRSHNAINQSQTMYPFLSFRKQFFRSYNVSTTFISLEYIELIVVLST